MRKTVAHKLKHIQSCAKKNKLTDSTVRILLRKELDSLPPVASTSKVPAEPETPVPTETLLEDVLKDAQKKKAGRRPQVLQTVKSISETRDTILDRARLLLQDNRNTRTESPTLVQRPESPLHSELPPATQAFGRSNVAAHSASPEMPAETTHVFGASRLGVAQTTDSRGQGGIVRAGVEIAAQSDVSPLTQILSANPLDASKDSVDEPMPPSTQIFAPSKFANARELVCNVTGMNGTRLVDTMSAQRTHLILC